MFNPTTNAVVFLLRTVSNVPKPKYNPNLVSGGHFYAPPPQRVCVHHCVTG